MSRSSYPPSMLPGFNTYVLLSNQSTQEFIIYSSIYYELLVHIIILYSVIMEEDDSDEDSDEIGVQFEGG